MMASVCVLRFPISIVTAVNGRSSRRSHLRLAETLSAFLTRLRAAAEALDIVERQRNVRLVVKEVLVNDDTIGDCTRPAAGTSAAKPGARLCVGPQPPPGPRRLATLPVPQPCARAVGPSAIWIARRPD